MTTHIPHLDVGSGRQRGALTLFPVWIDAPEVDGFEWASTDLEIGEVADGAQVGRLTVENTGVLPTVLLEGDLLVGGMQHRMAASSTVLCPLSADRVDVLCVEQGRWSGERLHRATGRRASYAVRQTNVAGREQGRVPQGDVWDRVRRYERIVSSPTTSMVDHLDAIVDEPVRLMEGQRGVIVGIGGRVIGMELFGSSAGLAARWDGLVRAAQLDARLAQPIPTLAQAARDLVRALGRKDLRIGAEQGWARSLHVDSKRLAVSGLTTLDGRDDLLHLAAFDGAHPLLAAA